MTNRYSKSGLMFVIIPFYNNSKLGQRPCVLSEAVRSENANIHFHHSRSVAGSTFFDRQSVLIYAFKLDWDEKFFLKKSQTNRS